MAGGARSKSVSQNRVVGEAGVCEQRTKLNPQVDKVIVTIGKRSGALHSLIGVWFVGANKHGPCAVFPAIYNRRVDVLISLPLWPFGLDQV